LATRAPTDGATVTDLYFSTFSDLEQHREAVYKALRKLRHDVITMEDYVATDKRSLDKCLADVESCDEGEPMKTARQRDQMWRLIYSLKSYWADRTGYYVGGNMFIHYDPDNRQRVRGPDFFLVLEVEDRERKSWVVWREGMRFPDMISELLSDSTRAIDKGEKKALYERVFRTAEYSLYEPFSHEFLGHHLQGVHYREVKPDEEGKIFSPVTGLTLAVRDGWLRWLTPEGQVVPTPQELAQHERQRAEVEHQRAEAEQQRAEAERQRADQAEELLEAYRRRFGPLE
jgi:Uma2 family endonuclease